MKFAKASNHSAKSTCYFIMILNKRKSACEDICLIDLKPNLACVANSWRRPGFARGWRAFAYYHSFLLRLQDFAMTVSAPFSEGTTMANCR